MTTEELIKKMRELVDEIDLDKEPEEVEKSLEEMLSCFKSHKCSASIFCHLIATIFLNKKCGLKEIKKEIRDIEKKLDDPCNGLAEIKEEIKDIEEKLDNPDFGLEEIKEEIKEIEEKLDKLVPPGAGNILTTGPVVADNGVNSILAKVMNNTDNTVTVTVKLFDIGTCPDPKELLQSFELEIESKCAKTVVLQKPTTEWEVVYEGVVPGVYVFTAGRKNAENAPISASELVETNLFRHSEHVVSIDP
ncbi:hypothetical protein [Thermovenabulum gondwanense]|uniref:Uncharacterized protein n=1 Tax=Thermovenabulum gondwanense TaxID=520767 RepID=A0A162MZJ2_9FIRM|nr:hypothetical protein [Thermovenabulum gondwanense]KYO68600.1 hypothetical protein ATZ99_01090 [Thermovenabulum gondwanense]